MNIWRRLKLQLKLLRRFATDLLSLDHFKFSKKLKQKINFPFELSLVQEVKVNETFESKNINFKKASEIINDYVMMPGEIFSFWNIIGNLVGEFEKGRTLRNGVIFEDVGGGLCQVSGILYYISLIAGLKILERHNHSVDIYNEETRFCPLGTDATLVYGYKDLRILNTFTFPIKFQLQVFEQSLEVKLLSKEKITEKELIFKIVELEDFKKVSIFDESNQMINTSKYKNLKQ